MNAEDQHMDHGGRGDRNHPINDDYDDEYWELLFLILNQ
jgi:hypothetical protein